MPLRTLTAALPLPKEEIFSNKWIHEGTQPNGTPITKGGQSAEALRRQGDSTWRVLIDGPWRAL